MQKTFQKQTSARVRIRDCRSSGAVPNPLTDSTPQVLSERVLRELSVLDVGFPEAHRPCHVRQMSRHAEIPIMSDFPRLSDRGH